MNELQTGDVLLFLPGSIMGRLAALFTWSKYSHAAMVSIENGVAQCVEVREFIGGRKIDLEQYLHDAPTSVEVWRLTGGNLGDRAASRMSEFIGCEYGWYHIALTVFQWAWRCNGFECKKHPPFCSEAVSQAYRNAGIDLRPDRPDRVTLPKHLAGSPYLRLVGRLSSKSPGRTP